MSQDELFPVPESFASGTHADNDTYLEMYQRSVDDPEAFWAEQGKRIDWFTPYTKIKDVSYDADDLHVKWYYDGTTNAAHNCLDRHLETRGDQTAIIWEGDDPAEDAKFTYRELHEMVCKFANGLKAIGAKKGDRITIYMPMIPEAAVAMLACVRIGAVHSIVFGGFSPDALAGRIHDCDSNIIITADEGLRGGRPIPLKANTDAALDSCPSIEKCVVVRRTGADIGWKDGRDVWYHDLVADASADCPAEVMNAEDPMFILYTSGSTGKPKGVMHTTGGYMVYASMTHQYVFDYHDGDIYWCTADVGWVTGHSYIVYGPLANGATTVMFEGVPTWPDAGRFWEVCAKHKVNQFYTAPTAIRALMGAGKVDLAKPWLNEIHISYPAPGDPVIKHELAHVVLGVWAPGPLGVPALGGLIPHMGIVEGMAEALEWSGRSLSLHEWSAAMRATGLSPPMESIVGAAGFWSQPASRAYTLSGSFLRWLLDQHGPQPLLALYEEGDFQAVYGQPLGTLVESWERYLDGLDLPPHAVALAEARFRRPGIFHRICGLEIAQLNQDIREASRDGRWREAILLQEEVLSHRPTDIAGHLGLARLLVRVGDHERLERVLSEARGIEGLHAVAEARFRELEADALWRSGRIQEASAVYGLLASAPQSRDRLRNVLVKRDVSQHPELEPVFGPYLLGGGAPDEATAYLTEAVADLPGQALPLYLLGRRHLQLGHREEGTRVLRHATSLLEGDEGLMGISADTRDQLRAEARWILGRALILLGEHQEGETEQHHPKGDIPASGPEASPGQEPQGGDQQGGKEPTDQVTLKPHVLVPLQKVPGWPPFTDGGLRPLEHGEGLDVSPDEVGGREGWEEGGQVPGPGVSWPVPSRLWPSQPAHEGGAGREGCGGDQEEEGAPGVEIGPTPQDEGGSKMRRPVKTEGA